jgi:hypothetical protein
LIEAIEDGVVSISAAVDLLFLQPDEEDLSNSAMSL